MYNQMADQTIHSMYSSARSRAWRGQVMSKLTGRPNGLHSLSEVNANCDVGARRHAGIQTIPIGQIRGSEGRCNDFDRDFNPLQDHTSGRWRGIAKAREQGKSLPPVDLVQLGDVYFVLDGHHRVSVAHALGQRDIEAKVTQWQVNGPLPWENAEAAEQETALGQLLSKVSEDGARIKDQVLTGVRGLVPAWATGSRAQQQAPVVAQGL
jgi:uncharacterized ParB-like nuclease family protein